MKNQIIIFILIFIIQKIYSLEEYSIQKPTDWILPIKQYNKQTQSDKNSFGLYYIIFEKQINMIDNVKQCYYHNVIQFIDSNGLSSYSQINIQFDLNYQRVILHSINIHRGNNKINLLKKDKIKFQEKDIDRNISKNLENIYIILDDLQIGDILEYEYTIVGQNPVFKDKFFDYFNVQFNIPVNIINYRLIYPNNKKLFIKNYKTDLLYNNKKFNSYSIYQWQNTNINPILIEDNIPEWFSPFPCIQLSEYESWEEVVNLFLKYYEPENENNEIIGNLLKEILKNKNNKNLESKIITILKYVQDDIKYLDNSISIIPIKPNLVINQGFGDCKDKSLLLVTLLRKIGVQAYPVLVNNYAGKVLNTFHPTPDIFNHVITLIKLKNKSYWVDATFTLQGGNLNTIYQNNYYYALVIAPNETNLTQVNIPFYDLVNKKINIEIKLPLKTTRRGKLIIESLYQNKSAEEIRNYINISKVKSVNLLRIKELEKKYKKLYFTYYPGIEKYIDTKYKDDLNKNQILTKEFYIIPSIWNIISDEKKYIFKLHEFDIVNYIKKPTIIDRKMPFSLEYPINIEENITIFLPKESEETKNYSAEIYNNNFQFDIQIKHFNKKLNFNYKFCNIKDHVAVNELNDYIKDIEKAQKMLNYEISYNKSELSIESKYSLYLNLFYAIIIILSIIILLILFPDFIIYIIKLIIKKKKI